MKHTPFDLSGTVAIVTGSSRGIGRSSAELLAKLGAKVVISSRKADACEEVAAGIRKAGGDAHVIACNISRREEVEALIAGTTRHYGKVDILVCNAGSAPMYPSLIGITEELFDKTMATNMKGAFRLAAVVGTRMQEAGRGSIIFISSVGSLMPTPRDLIYGAAKASLNAFAHGLSRTLGPQVRVNAVLPGPFRTDITKSWDIEAFEAEAKVAYALGRVGEPDEIVGTCLYLGSDASSYTTGVLLRVDGGPRKEM